MASIMPQCRGFTHPFVLLVRSTLRSRSSLESSPRTTTSSLCFLTNPSRHPRLFSSCRALCNNNKNEQTPPTAKRSGPLAAKIHPLSHYTHAQRLAMKSQPTTLYEAASQTGFLISSYGAAFFCFGSAGINSWFNVYNLPPGISDWVPVGFGVVSFVFAALGTIFALRPSSIIRSIKVLPNMALQKAPASPSQPVLLEIAVRRIAPIPLPLRRMQVAPDCVVLVNRMQKIRTARSAESLANKSREDAKRRKEQRQYELDHLMTAPFRDARRASTSLFDNIRRGLTGEGFAPVFINGVKYKLDLDGGYSLDNGQVMDRIVKIQPDPNLARIQSESLTKGT